jgi:hypothetical protein
VGLLVDLHRGTHATFKAFGVESTMFDIHGGVRQGCNIAPTLFNLDLDFVTKQASAALGAEVGVKVAHMEHSKLPKQIFQGKLPKGKKGLRRPPTSI